MGLHSAGGVRKEPGQNKVGAFIQSKWSVRVSREWAGGRWGEKSLPVNIPSIVQYFCKKNLIGDL